MILKYLPTKHLLNTKGRKEASRARTVFIKRTKVPPPVMGQRETGCKGENTAFVEFFVFVVLIVQLPLMYNIILAQHL